MPELSNQYTNRIEIVWLYLVSVCYIIVIVIVIMIYMIISLHKFHFVENISERPPKKASRRGTLFAVLTYFHCLFFILVPIECRLRCYHGELVWSSQSNSVPILPAAQQPCAVSRDASNIVICSNEMAVNMKDVAKALFERNIFALFVCMLL